MKKVMFGDRLFNRVKQTEFVVFDRTSRENEARETNWHSNLKKAYEKGKTLFSPSEKVFSLEDRYFTAVSNSETGEVSDQTIFSYHQKENVIWAEYSGGHRLWTDRSGEGKVKKDPCGAELTSLKTVRGQPI
jgi:hypothetical protein